MEGGDAAEYPDLIAVVDSEKIGAAAAAEYPDLLRLIVGITAIVIFSEETDRCSSDKAREAACRMESSAAAHDPAAVRPTRDRC